MFEDEDGGEGGGNPGRSDTGVKARKKRFESETVQIKTRMSNIKNESRKLM